MAMALFVGNDTLVKLAAARLPASEIMALRGLIAVMLVASLVLRSDRFYALRDLARGSVILRGLMEGAIAFTFICAIATASLGQVNTILQVSPLLITVGAAWLLRERVGKSLWLATLTAFAGVVLVIQPGLQGIEGSTMLALLSAVLVAIRDLYTRRIDAKIPSLVVTLASTLSVPLIGLALTPLLSPWLWPTPAETALLVGAGCLVATGNVFIVRAFRSGGEISVISPFRYSVVLWSLLSSLLVFGEPTNLVALVGTAMIVGSGLFVWRVDARDGNA